MIKYTAVVDSCQVFDKGDRMSARSGMFCAANHLDLHLADTGDTLTFKRKEALC